MKTNVAFSVLIVLSFVRSALAGLVYVAESNFGGANIINESFEESLDLSNAEIHSNSSVSNGIAIVGKYSSYTFTQSGITLSAPIPNIIGNFLPMIAVYRAQQGLGLSVYGALNSSNLPPDGNKFLIEYGSSAIPFAAYELIIPGNGASKISGYWFMHGNNPAQNKLQVDAYGATNNYLGSALIPAASVSDGNWSNNFYGFSADNGEPIKKIAINYSTGANPGVDMLMFEPAIAGSDSPEPGSWVMLATGGIFGGLFLLRRKRKASSQNS